MNELRAHIARLLAELETPPDQVELLLARLAVPKNIPEVAGEVYRLMKQRESDRKLTVDLEVEKMKRDLAEETARFAREIQDLEREVRQAAHELRQEHDAGQIDQLRQNISSL